MNVDGLDMVDFPANTLLTVDEYLAFERASEERHEYLDGQVSPMASVTYRHSTITVHLIVELGQQLKRKSGEVFSPNMKVRSGRFVSGNQVMSGIFSYPDLIVVWDPPEFHDYHQDILLNPKVIFEVLSPGTETFDRTEKFDRYRENLDSLTDYILIAQDQPLVEHRRRQANGEWATTLVPGIESVLELPSIECRLQLSELYDRVEFLVEGQAH
ncbi:MAG TPA: Uma2 family endonuclease [Acidobacteriota bacterium]|nr:Uma2 family endonuclease [Acidobacteriota bacterium]